MRRIALVRGVVLSVLVALPAMSQTTAPADLPRYSLPVGRRLTYASTSEDKPTTRESSGFSYKNTFQVTVVRENPDGSRRVILRSGSQMSQTSSTGKADAQPERVDFSYADVSSDGQFKSNPTLGMYSPLTAVFPPLPRDATGMRDGWTATNKAKMETTRYARLAGAPGTFDFSAVSDGVIDKLYKMTFKTVFHFDPARGLIAASEGERTQDYGFHTRGTTRMTLNSDEMLPPAEAKSLADGFDRFFAAKGKYGALMDQMDEQPTRADTLIAQAKAVLENARAQATDDEVKQAFAVALKNHDESAGFEKEEADRIAKLLDKPAPGWSSTTIDGKPIKLADFKGKVVVMDFWYRGCGWCMYATPQVKELAADYKNKPVVVLGMNTDRQEQDINAQAVIDAFDLKYPVIKAGEIATTYGIQAFPTLLIVDQSGAIRGMDVGYGPTLRTDIGRKIDALLTKPQAGKNAQ